MNYDVVNLEILRMAKELVMNDYTDKRAELHNKWLVESEHLWKTQRLRLAYPTIPPHPTEADIVSVARVLMEFVSQRIETPEDPQPTPEKEIPVVEEVVLEPMIEENIPVPEVPEVIEKPKKNALVMLDHTAAVDTEPKPEVNETNNKVLPKVLQRLEEMKRNFF